MKLTIKNISTSPTFVHAISGSIAVAIGQTVTDDFSDAEAANINGNTNVFDVSGYVDPETGKVSVGKSASQSEIIAINDENNGLRAKLKGIADLFGTPDVDVLNVHAAVEKLIQDSKPKSPTLAEAVGLLDDKNDAHWTKAGHPSIAALKTITGADVSAEDLDRITPPRVRK